MRLHSSRQSRGGGGAYTRPVAASGSAPVGGASGAWARAGAGAGGAGGVGAGQLQQRGQLIGREPRHRQVYAVYELLGQGVYLGGQDVDVPRR